MTPTRILTVDAATREGIVGINTRQTINTPTGQKARLDLTAVASCRLRLIPRAGYNSGESESVPLLRKRRHERQHTETRGNKSTKEKNCFRALKRLSESTVYIPTPLLAEHEETASCSRRENFLKFISESRGGWSKGTSDEPSPENKFCCCCFFRLNKNKLFHIHSRNTALTPKALQTTKGYSLNNS